MVDVVDPILMALRFAPGYAVWWVGVHPDIIGMDEEVRSNDDEVANEHFKDDDRYQINNPIHDVPSQEGEGVDILTVLIIATPTLGKNINM